MPQQAAELDQVFQALADPTRRQVVERLVSGSASKSGRVRTYALAPAALAVADGWLAEQRRMWERRLDQLDDLLSTLDDSPFDTKEHR